MKPDMDALAAAAGDASEFLKSLASPVRLRILCLMAGREISVGEISETLEARQSLVSQHLALLRKDGLVTTRREGQTIWYMLADDRVLKMIKHLHAMFCEAPAPKGKARPGPARARPGTARASRAPGRAPNRAKRA